MTEEKEHKEKEEPGSSAGEQPMQPLPAPEFVHLIETFGMQALISMGKVMSPLTQKVEKNKELAKYYIGVLEVLEKKTKGNLDGNERAVLETTLHTLRMSFVDEFQGGKAKEAEEKKAEETKPENEEKKS